MRDVAKLRAMARVVCVINNKGGVGKTNVCVNLSAFLAAMGKRVLLIDCDHQGNATFSVGIRPQNLSLSVYNVLLGEINAEAVIKSTSILGFDILPANQALAGANVELVSAENREFKLAETIKGLETNYEFIIIDTPPSLGILTVNALCAANEVIIPIQAEYLALEGVNQILETISLVQDNLGHEFNFIGAVLTMHSRGNVIAREVSKELTRDFGGYVFDASIPRLIDLAAAPKFGKPIVQYAPNSKAAQIYRYFAQEFLHVHERLAGGGQAPGENINNVETSQTTQI